MADHAKTTTTDNTMTIGRIKSVVLLIVQLYSVVQTGLTLAGFNALPFTSDDVSAAITGVIAVIASVYAWWRNNNMTEAAVEGQKLTDSIKSGVATAVQGTDTVSDTTVAVDAVSGATIATASADDINAAFARLSTTDTTAAGA